MSEASMKTIHDALGASFELLGGRSLPIHYGEPAGEQRALERSPCLADFGHFGLLEVTGSDRAVFLQGLLTNDVVNLPVDTGCENALLTFKARVQTLMTVLALEDSFWLVLPDHRAAAKTLDALELFLIREDCQFRDVSTEYHCLYLGGADASNVALAMAGPRESALDTETPLDPRVTHTLGQLPSCGHDVRITTRADAPELGYRLWLKAAHVEAAWAELAAGSTQAARPIGWLACESRRIAHGHAVFERDIAVDDFLPEFPHDHLVNLKKGCFLGQEPIARITYRGRPNRKLVGMRWSGDLPETTEIRVGDKVVGNLRSRVFSHSRNTWIGLALVRTAAADAESEFRLGAVTAQHSMFPIPV